MIDVLFPVKGEDYRQLFDAILVDTLYMFMSFVYRKEFDGVIQNAGAPIIMDLYFYLLTMCEYQNQYFFILRTNQAGYIQNVKDMIGFRTYDIGNPQAKQLVKLNYSKAARTKTDKRLTEEGIFYAPVISKTRLKQFGFSSEEISDDVNGLGLTEFYEEGPNPTPKVNSIKFYIKQYNESAELMGAQKWLRRLELDVPTKDATDSVKYEKFIAYWKSVIVAILDICFYVTVNNPAKKNVPATDFQRFLSSSSGNNQKGNIGIFKLEYNINFSKFDKLEPAKALLANAKFRGSM